MEGISIMANAANLILDVNQEHTGMEDLNDAHLAHLGHSILILGHQPAVAVQ